MLQTSIPVASPITDGMPANFIQAKATPVLEIQDQALQSGKQFHTSHPQRTLYAGAQALDQPPVIRLALSDAVPQKVSQQAQPLYGRPQQQAPSQWQGVQASILESLPYFTVGS